MTIKILDEDVVYFGGAEVGAPLVAGMRISDKLYMGTAGGGFPSIDVLLSGVSPLVLYNTISLNYVKAFGKCEQDLTPTPSTPSPIVCNNGTLKVKDDELPVGYKRIASIKGDGSLYYDTGEKLLGSDVITLTASPATSSGQNLFGAYSGTGDSNYNFSLFVYLSASSQCYLRYGNSLYRPIWGSTAKRTVSIGAPATTGFYSDRNITEQDFTTDDNAWIFALPNSSSAKFTGYIYGEITVGNRLKYIPCERESDNVIGYYETHTQTFLEPKGGTPTAGNYDTSHLTEVYVDTDTQETVTITDENSTLVSSATVENLLGIGNFKDFQNIKTGNITRNVGVLVLTGDEDWQTGGSGTSYRAYITDDIGLPNTENLTTPMICSHYPFDAYFSTGGDTQPETFNAWASSGNNSYFLRFSLYGMGITSAAEWANWLKAQAAAGNPVIVVYPKATATSESVTGQTLTVAQGTNTVTATGSVDNLELEVSYKAAVTVTVEEIEAVQLDENVVVTIS